MALSGVAQSVERYQLRSSGGEIQVSCPPLFARLLSATLSGWEIERARIEKKPDVTITFSDGVFRVASERLGIVSRYSDLMDVLNVLFNILAKIYWQRISTKTMIHCAAFVTDSGVSTLVLGSKKVGKSSLTWKSACYGGTVLADDILLWDQLTGEFECLGLPVRLRRPVRWHGNAGLVKKGVIAGKHLAYTRNSIIAIAPAGYVFIPEEILFAKSVGVFKPIPLTKIKRMLLDSRIS